MSNESIKEILKERENSYGDFSQQSSLSQVLKDCIHLHPKWSDMNTSHKESIEMILHKISRIVNGDPNHIDSWEDIAGYATLISDSLKEDV